MRPRSAETSAPACTKRKILSMNSSTSRCSSSRKYSATVRPVSPTRRREPGGSVICPYISAARDFSAFGHFQPQIVAFARALSHAGKHGNAAVLHGHVVNQLHDEHSLAHAR